MIEAIALLHFILLKQKVYNPTLPYIILLTLIGIAFCIFAFYYYNQLKENFRLRLEAKHADTKFRMNLAFNYALNGTWCIQTGHISFSQDLVPGIGNKPQEIPLYEFRDRIQTDEDRQKFIHITENRKEAVGQRFRMLADLNGEQEYTWWEMICMVHQGDELRGIIVNRQKMVEEEKRLQNAIHVKESFEKKENLLASMNQEISAPMSAVMGYAELLSHQDLEIDKKTQEEYVRIISHNSSALLKMLDDAVKEGGKA